MRTEFLEPTVVTPATQLAVSLDEVKEHLRIDGSVEDSDLERKVKAAIRELERYTGRTLCEVEYRLYLNSWPSTPFHLPRACPLIDVVSIKYRDVDGVQHTLTTSVYEVDTSSLVGRVGLADGESYPSDQLSALSPIEITYRAGIADDASPRPEVDPDIVDALMIRIGSMTENREAEFVSDRAAREPVSLKYGWSRAIRNLCVTPNF